MVAKVVGQAAKHSSASSKLGLPKAAKRALWSVLLVAPLLGGCAGTTFVVRDGPDPGSQMTTLTSGGVNSYILRTGPDCFMIDTGFPEKRPDVEKQLLRSGCGPGHLKLAVLTHGDVDHVGNSAFLREKYGAKIAIHTGDASMVEQGNMGVGRKKTPDKDAFIFQMITLFSSNTYDGFKPDILLNDGDDLSPYGIAAKVVHIPGHSKGSIGLLTRTGDLFCGDLLVNVFHPDLHFYIDDMQQATASIEKLRKLGVGTIYPGHGEPFRLEQLGAAP